MDVGKLLDQLIAAAKTLSPMIPALGMGAEIAEKIADIFDNLKEDIPLDRQAEAQAARAELAQRVIDKVDAEAAALRGE